MVQDRYDPIFDYILGSRLQPYIPKVREWWAKIPDLSTLSTGLFGIPDSPPGLMYRFTRSAKKSPLPGIQAFPLVPTAFLQITGITGGSVKMVERVCFEDRFHIEEFVIIEKHNLPSTFNAGQFVAFVPIDIYADTKSMGQWIYMTSTELMYLAMGHVTKEVQDKVKLKI